MGPGRSDGKKKEGRGTKRKRWVNDKKRKKREEVIEVKREKGERKRREWEREEGGRGGGGTRGEVKEVDQEVEVATVHGHVDPHWIPLVLSRPHAQS